MSHDALSAEMRAVMAQLATLNGSAPSRYDLKIPAARAALLEQRRWWQTGAPPMQFDESFEISTDSRSISLRRLVPARARTDRVVIYLHGGGWCVGSNATHHAPQAWIAIESDCEVIGVDYALAPEHPFPAAINDVRAAVDWVIRARPGRDLIFVGDSAGANLALVEALRRRDTGEPNARLLVLMYGCYGPLRNDGSYLTYGTGSFGLSNDALRQYMTAYAPNVATTEWRVFPIHADLRGLPPLQLFSAQCDPLADDSHQLAQVARDAGVAVMLTEYPGVIHGFTAYWRMLRIARTMLVNIGEVIAALGSDATHHRI